MIGENIDSICMMLYGEDYIYYRIGKDVNGIKLKFIKKIRKIIGHNEHQTLGIDCYIGYGDNLEKLFEVNEGMGLEIRYKQIKE